MSDRIAIRCCCRAGLVLGTVPKPLAVGNGQKMTFELPDGAPLELPVAVCSTGSFALGTIAEEIAVKSMETPLDVLRQIDGFVEVNQLVPIGTPQESYRQLEARRSRRA